MIDTIFRYSLENHVFPGSSANQYIVNVKRSLPIYFRTDREEIPLILRGEDKEGISFHDKESGNVSYSVYTGQFGSRIVNHAKIMEIMNGCPIPIIIKVATGKFYLAGKGFLATCSDIENPNTSDIKLLLVACAKNGASSNEDIKIYVSRNVMLEENKKILLPVSEIIDGHKGDTITTNNIEYYLSKRIDIPIHKSLRDKELYEKKLLDFCSEKLKENFAKSES